MRLGTDTATARRDVAMLAILVLSLAGFSCMQPEVAADEFGTGEASSVTGESDDDDGRDDDGRDDEGESAQDAADDGEDEEDEPGGDDETSVDDTEDPADDETDDDEVSDQGGARTPADAGVRSADRSDASVRGSADAALTDDPGAEPAPDAAGMDEPEGPAPTKLTFEVTTATMRGRYSPRNVYAIWVVDGQGKFVKTLARAAFIRARYLTGWNSASGGNLVDATTGATERTHGTRKVTWDLTDAAGDSVPDGDYKIVIEMTENDRTGVSTMVPFTKGSSPLTLMPPDEASFTKMSLILD